MYCEEVLFRCTEGVSLDGSCGRSERSSSSGILDCDSAPSGPNGPASKSRFSSFDDNPWEIREVVGLFGCDCTFRLKEEALVKDLSAGDSLP